MLKIRLQRVGRRNDPSFRVVVTDSRKGPKSADYLEILGFHNPKLSSTELKNERITHWIGHGAQVSGTVHNLLVQNSVIEGKKINVLPKKSPIVKEEAGTPETGRKPQEAASSEGESADDSTEKEEAPAEKEVKEEEKPKNEEENPPAGGEEKVATELEKP